MRLHTEQGSSRLFWRFSALLCALCASASSLVFAQIPVLHSSGLAAARAEIEKKIAASGAEVSIAFRTLDGKDEWFREADKEYHAASTMKVPVMIELFAQVREGKRKLDDEIAVFNQFKSLADGGPYTLSPSDDSETELYKAVGQQRTLRQLCELMITVSSNLATNVLIETLGVGNIRRRVSSLGAEGMQVRRGVEDGAAFRAGINNTTTARGLFMVMDKLARGEAGDADSTREMVDILKRQKFRDGIPAGIPAGIAANKTGEITGIHHDAAVVFGPRPFVLVILTRGIADRAASAQLMAEVARLLYQVTQA